MQGKPPPLYTLYIDETGTHGLTAKALVHDKQFCLFGSVVRRTHYKDFLVPELNAIKRDIFGAGGESVVLHQVEIDARSGAFTILEDRDLRHRYNCRMVSLLRALDFRCVAIAVDKVQHQATYRGAAWNPYSYTAKLLFERFCLYLRWHGGVGMIRAESRSDAEDALLEAEFQRYRCKGTGYVDAATFATHITVPNIHFLKKSDNVLGLQVSDVLANMALEEMMVETGRKRQVKEHARRHYLGAIRDKWDAHPNTGIVWGCGKVYLPKNTKAGE